MYTVGSFPDVRLRYSGRTPVRHCRMPRRLRCADAPSSANEIRAALMAKSARPYRRTPGVHQASISLGFGRPPACGRRSGSVVPWSQSLTTPGSRSNKPAGRPARLTDQAAAVGAWCEWNQTADPPRCPVDAPHGHTAMSIPATSPPRVNTLARGRPSLGGCLPRNQPRSRPSPPSRRPPTSATTVRACGPTASCSAWLFANVICSPFTSTSRARPIVFDSLHRLAPREQTLALAAVKAVVTTRYEPIARGHGRRLKPTRQGDRPLATGCSIAGSASGGDGDLTYDAGPGHSRRWPGVRRC